MCRACMCSSTFMYGYLDNNPTARKEGIHLKKYGRLSRYSRVNFQSLGYGTQLLLNYLKVVHHEFICPHTCAQNNPVNSCLSRQVTMLLLLLLLMCNDTYPTCESAHLLRTYMPRNVPTLQVDVARFQLVAHLLLWHCYHATVGMQLAEIMQDHLGSACMSCLVC
jgi:hypothetical protein